MRAMDNEKCNEIEITSNNGQQVQSDGNLKHILYASLVDILQTTGTTFEAANIWILNQVAVPLTQGSGLTKFRYLVPENDFILYNTATAGQQQQQQQRVNNNNSIDQDAVNNEAENGNKPTQVLNKVHVHTCYAFNQAGNCSIPLVVFPVNELDANCTQALMNTTVIDETPTGDINETIFLKWLDGFLMHNAQQTKPGPVILLCNSMIPISKCQSVHAKCLANNVHMLYYQLDDQSEIFNKSIFIKFKDTWKCVLTQYAQKDNPHTQLSFLYVFKQVLRKIVTLDLVKECFRDFLKLYRLPRPLQSTVMPTTPTTLAITGATNSHQSPPVSSYANETFLLNSGVFLNPDYVSEEVTVVNCDDQGGSANNVSSFEDHYDYHQMNDDEYAGNNQSNSNPTNIKFTQQEINEFIEWINYMCSIGCSCLKYTFLRDLSLKVRPNAVNKSTKEHCVYEKKWFELIKKAKNHLASDSCCFNEDEYMLKWFNMMYWRKTYVNRLKMKNIHTEQQLWTFDIISFPYMTNNCTIRAPERDTTRPRNIKPRVSVIFAFNANGDYTQPFFCYPFNFASATSPHVDTELNENECYSNNGYVNSKIFAIWLNKIFIPQTKRQNPVKQSNQDCLLLYCSKLAVVDHANMRTCLTNRINLFTMTHEQIMPFNMLFQKSSRKRQTDLLLDSWRKVTAKRALSYQFVLTSKELFADLFMCTLQNCIDELGGDFPLRLKQTFDNCLLWPPVYDEDDSVTGKVDYDYDLEAEESYAKPSKTANKRTSDASLKGAAVVNSNKLLPVIKMARSRTTGRRRKVRKDFDFEYDYNVYSNNAGGGDDDDDDDSYDRHNVEQHYTEEDNEFAGDEDTAYDDGYSYDDDDDNGDGPTVGYDDQEEQMMAINEYNDDENGPYEDMDETEYDMAPPNGNQKRKKKAKKNANKKVKQETHLYTYDDQYVHQTETESNGLNGLQNKPIKHIQMTLLELIETDADFNQNLKSSIQVQLVDLLCQRIMAHYVHANDERTRRLKMFDNVDDFRTLVCELLTCLLLTHSKPFTVEFIDLKNQTCGLLGRIVRQCLADLDSNCAPSCVDNDAYFAFASALDDFYLKYSDDDNGVDVNMDTSSTQVYTAEQLINNTSKSSGIELNETLIVDLYNQFKHEPIDFLRQLCAVVFDRRMCGRQSKTTTIDNVKCFDLIKKLMFKLYPNSLTMGPCGDQHDNANSNHDHQVNWSKCLTIINECF